MKHKFLYGLIFMTITQSMQPMQRFVDRAVGAEQPVGGAEQPVGGAAQVRADQTAPHTIMQAEQQAAAVRLHRQITHHIDPTLIQGDETILPRKVADHPVPVSELEHEYAAQRAPEDRIMAEAHNLQLQDLPNKSLQDLQQDKKRYQQSVIKELDEVANRLDAQVKLKNLNSDLPKEIQQLNTERAALRDQRKEYQKNPTPEDIFAEHQLQQQIAVKIYEKIKALRKLDQETVLKMHTAKEHHELALKVPITDYKPKHTVVHSLPENASLQDLQRTTESLTQARKNFQSYIQHIDRLDQMQSTVTTNNSQIEQLNKERELLKKKRGMVQEKIKELRNQLTNENESSTEQQIHLLLRQEHQLQQQIYQTLVQRYRERQTLYKPHMDKTNYAFIRKAEFYLMKKLQENQPSKTQPPKARL